MSAFSEIGNRRRGVGQGALSNAFMRYGIAICVAILLALLVIVPLSTIFAHGLLEFSDGYVRPSFAAFRRVLGAPSYWYAFGSTLVIGVGAALVATILGVALAWMLVRTNTPWAPALEQFALVPIFFPPFIGAFAWILLLAPRTGLANVVARWFGLPEPFGIYSYGGIVWVMGIYLAPYAMMVVASALRNMDPALEEAAEVSGLSTLMTTLKITLPLIAPAILSGFTLTFVITTGIFGTPVLLGWSKHIFPVTTSIYLELQQYPPGYGTIAVLAIYLIVLSVGVTAFQNMILSRNSYTTVTGKGFRVRPILLGNLRYLLLALSVAYVLFTVLVPTAVIVAAALSTFTWSGVFTLKHVRYLFEASEVRDAVRTTLVIALLAATGSVLLGIVVAWISTRTTLFGRRILELVAMAPASVPSLAFGVGVGFFWLKVPLDVYGTIWVMILAFVGRYCSYAVRTVSGSLVQIHPELEESARVGGYGPVKTVLRITLPLVRPGIVSSWLMLYSIFMTELSIAITLYTADTRTLSVINFTSWQNNPFPRVAALALLQLVVGLLVLIVTRRLTRGRKDEPVTAQ